MTIQEYIRIAIAGVPKEDFDYYKEFFTDMSCEHCIYNGFACKVPKVEDVCMDYRVERSHKEFVIQGNKKDISKWDQRERGMK